MTEKLLVIATLVATAPWWGKIIAWLKDLGEKLVKWMTGLIMQRVYVDDDVAEAILEYLREQGREIRAPSDKAYSTIWAYVKSLGKKTTILVRNRGVSSSLFWYGRRPIIFEGRPNEQNNNVTRTHNWSFLFVRGTLDFEKLALVSLNEQKTEDTAESKNRFTVHRITGSGGGPRIGGSSLDDDDSSESGIDDEDVIDAFAEPIDVDVDDIGRDRPEKFKIIDKLSLSPELINLRQEIVFWHDNREWHEERGVPWRRGYLLYGPPGTGKTSFVTAVCQEINMPIYSMDLGSMENRELVRSWNNALNNVPACILLEDFDSVFDGRENMSECGLTFDCLLNCINGAGAGSGILLFITTNRVESLDSALYQPRASGGASRPGRIDRAVLVSGVDQAGRLKIAKRILLGHPDVAERLAREATDDTPAQFQERCFEEAIKLLFAKQNV